MDTSLDFVGLASIYQDVFVQNVRAATSGDLPRLRNFSAFKELASFLMLTYLKEDMNLNI